MPEVCLYVPYARFFVALGLAVSLLAEPEHQGQVLFGGSGIPGATIRATFEDRALVALTDKQGRYALPGLAPGTWKLRVEMPYFAPQEKMVTVPPVGDAPIRWELALLPVNRKPAFPAAATVLPTAVNTDANRSDPTGALLINGTVNNGAASPFGQSGASGNTRKGRLALYNGSIGLNVGDSALDARAFSLTGQDSPKPAYNRFTGEASFGGPLRIPRLLWQRGPTLTLNYQWTRDRDATTQSGLTPTPAERTGDLSSRAIVRDPGSGEPFAGNRIPATRISSAAIALLNLYPTPNLPGNASYNFQVPVVGATHEDSWQTRATQTINRKNAVYGSFSGQRTRADSGSLFGFVDHSTTSGLNTSLALQHLYTPHLSTSLSYQYSQLLRHVKPFFAGRQNISSLDGIHGNDQDPVNWGPPNLSFASGLASLTDVSASELRNRTSAVSFRGLWNRERHNVAFGVAFRRQQFNLLSQQDARGSFNFTGSRTGSDLGDFLLGLPATESIAFGNADKYLRGSGYEAYLTDDFRVSSGFTVNVGARWDYTTPITERYGRLVNLEATPGFSAVRPIVASQSRAEDLVHSYKRASQPRIAMSWRPFADSSAVVRGGYGIYYDGSVYLPLAMRMAQQAPLSRSFVVAFTPGQPLDLATGLTIPVPSQAATFGVDPHLRIGYAQNWSLGVQQDLPWALIWNVSYTGVKGTGAPQEILPNTYPQGGLSACASCPTGFSYLASNGNSIRHAGQFQLRRRVADGLAATVQYTFSKSIDNGSPGGLSNPASLFVAQNWLDLRSERALSSFDQRHLLSVTTQFTTGTGKSWFAAADSGWYGALMKDWTLSSQWSIGSGLPLTPLYFAPATGSGFIGTLRPDYTGALLSNTPPGLAFNPQAYATPSPGHWGNAGRNTIEGPGAITMNGSLARTLRRGDRLNLDLRLDAANALNHPNFTRWNTTLNSAQFGLPVSANGMRTVQTTVRLRF